MTTQYDEKQVSSLVRALIWDGICLLGDTATPDSVADYVMKRFDPDGKLSSLMAHAAWSGARQLAVEEMAWQDSGPNAARTRNGLSAEAARLQLEAAISRAKTEAQKAIAHLPKDASSGM